MSSPVEERLRRALEQQAEATTVASDGWRQIRTRIDQDGRRRRPAILRWTMLVPAAALGVALVVLAQMRGDGDREIQVTGGSGRLFLVPTGVEPRFHPASADTDPPVPSPPPGTYRAFGRRAADGVALDASVVITVPVARGVVGAITEPAPLRVLDRDVAVARDDFGQRILTWTQSDGQTVEVMTYALSDAELVALAASLLPGDAAKDTPTLPSGFTPVTSGNVPTDIMIAFSLWEAADGSRFHVSVTEPQPATIDDLVRWLPGGRAVQVRGSTGIVSDRTGTVYLIWIERPGAVVSMDATGLAAAELLAIAEGLQPVDDDAWRGLVARAGRSMEGSGAPFTVQPGSPQERSPSPTRSSQVLTSENSYLLLRPVTGRLDPPCPGPSTGGPSDPVVAERVAGQELACYRVGPPLFFPGSVASATAVPILPDGDRWVVAVRPNAEGRRALETLARQPGAQVVVLVDGEVVAAPRLDASMVDEVLVTGLDESAARKLADRLNG